MSGMGEAYLTQDTVKRMPELHSFTGGKACSFLVDIGESVVDDSSGAAVSLWDDAHGRDAETGQ
jgi:hypothetical protein